jgi:type I restriction-modification system DNA methylase subunit
VTTEENGIEQWFFVTKAQDSLDQIRKWSGGNEPDLYPYIKDFFVGALGYPKDKVKINATGREGFPDIVLISKDSTSSIQTAWVSAEVKKEPRIFRDPQARREVLESRLKKYVTADTVHGLLIDPLTIAVYLPDCRETKVVKLDEVQIGDLLDPNSVNSLAFLSYDNSVSEISIAEFREGSTPVGYLSIASTEEREKLHDALRICARELIDYASAKLNEEKQMYKEFASELESLKGYSINNKSSLRVREARLRSKYSSAIHLIEEVLPEFERQIGKQTPTDPGEAADYITEVFGTEAASLVLSRIVFVRFAEDNALTTRKISNGGIRVFRSFYTYIKDDYRWLLRGAYEDARQIYARLFEESIFDWVHEGNGQLARILERIFYRLNAFNFGLITGDILGNIYEAFLDRPRRKKLGEYYTKPAIVKFILDKVGFPEEPAPLLDPACGSGSFLVKALLMSVDKMISRGVKPKNAIESSLELIHGLDINVFASFVTQLQILWSIFPYLASNERHRMPEANVYGGLNSLEYDPQLTLGEALTAPLEREATLIRDSKYRFVVGNPPYIRNERLKDRGPWRAYYSTVDRRNSDIAFYFVQRALLGGKRETDVSEDTMPPWLEDKGILGFVLSLGFANSQAALALRQAILKFKILHLVDLELVAYRLFDADVVPMLVVVQKEDPPADWTVSVRVVDPSHKDDDGNIDIGKAPAHSVRQSLLQENLVNPFGYFLTKLMGKDSEILEKLLAKRQRLARYALPFQDRAGRGDTDANETVEEEEPSNFALMYGMKLGSGDKIKTSQASGTYPIFKGSDVATYYLDRGGSEGWVNPDDAEGKSIWGHLEELHEAAYVLPCIVIAPIAAKFNPKDLAFNNSTIVFVPDNDHGNFPWDAYFNSALVRFIHHVSLRTTILLRRRCTLYPRTFEVLPVSDTMFDHQDELNRIAEEFRTLASAIKRRWDIIEEKINASEKKRLAVFPGVDFSNWGGTAIGSVVLADLNGEEVLTAIAPDQSMSMFFLRGPQALLKMVAFLLPDDEDAEISANMIQRLEVPTDYEAIVKAIDDADNPASPDILRFKKLSAEADMIIEASFGLSEEDRQYIHKRLGEHPLALLEPRYPWTAGAHHQKTRVYAPSVRFG